METTMPKTIDISKGIESFDDRTDFSRNNTERKPWGKSNSADALNLGSEYDVTVPAVEPAAVVPAVVPPVVEAPKKFTHKLANGTTLEAATVEELAAQIEKSFNTQAPVPVEFEDKPLYQPVEFKRKELSLTEQANILNVWKENPQKALRMLEEAEYGVSMDVLLQNLSRAELRELNRMQEEAGAAFLMDNETYNPTRANGKKLTDYLKEKGKPTTTKNLTVAFQQLVAAGDKTLLRKVDDPAPVVVPVVVADDLEDSPAPPVVVPSNQGLPGAPPTTQLDPAKFATMTLAQQKDFFAKLRRG
jgi:hypothetical protein